MRSAGRLLRKIREAGWRKAPVVVADSVRRAIAPRLNDRRIVYRVDPEAFAALGQAALVPGMKVLRVERLNDVPRELWERMEAGEAAQLEAQFAGEFARDAVLWLAVIDGEIAGSQWTAEGRHRPDWFVALEPDDQVLYAVSTRSAFRGRGVHSALMRHIIAHGLSKGADVYCDVAVWNGVARRNSEKVGFRPIGEFAPLKT